MVGKIVNGYKINEFRGKGSFGSVYRCTKENESYAIKIFALEYVFEEYKRNKSHNRITQEIEALKRIHHNNVVKIFDYGDFTELNITYMYIVMEYLDGNNLKEILASNGELNLDLCCDYGSQILYGLDVIHKNMIVHRDLKPENIFLTKTNTIKIVDFGLSKIIDFSSITATGTQIGSPLYMSPEQIKDSKNIDYRSDYYCFGVIFFELLTNTTPYGRITSREELFYKIINDRPLSVTQFKPTIPNSIDNLIIQLLEKENFKRPNNIEIIIRALCEKDFIEPEERVFEPTFFLRLYNEKKVLEDFYKDGFHLDYYIFPVNHQRLTGISKHIQDTKTPFIVDPATMRLAYDTFADVKGLVSLPYSPAGYNKLEIQDFETLSSKQLYVQSVVSEQLKFNPTGIVAPFHISNNSNLITIKNDSNENWFSIDVKLLKETKEYLTKERINLPLVGGFSIRADILTTKAEQEYFLNVLSGLPCDYYLIYVDCIDYTSNSSQVYHYIKTLYTLQKATGKPVIAGRVNSIGLLLLSFGIYGFEAGTARFERFSEDLYSETSDPYNMYVMYYIPELLKNIAVKRKDPSKIFDILEHNQGQNLKCTCPYCQNKNPEEIVVDEITKKHFLYRRIKEVSELKTFSVSERLDIMSDRIDKAIGYYKNIRPVFKAEDYAFLSVWKQVVKDLREELAI